MTPDQPRIETPCPSCGSRNLFIGEGGHLTCSLIGCLEPGVERAIAALRAAPPAPAPELALLELRAIAKSLGLLAEPLLDAAPKNGHARRRERDELITNLRRAEGRVIDAMQAIRLAWTPAAPVEPPARPETAAPTPQEDKCSRCGDPLFGAGGCNDSACALRKLAAVVYQVAGAYSLPERILDILSAAAAGKPFSVAGVLPTAAPTPAPTADLVEAFYQRVNDAAEADMLRGRPVTGAHHRALEREIQRHRAALSSPVGETPEGK